MALAAKNQLSAKIRCRFESLECYLFHTSDGTGWRIARFSDGRWKKIATGSIDVDLQVWTRLKAEFNDGTLTFAVDGTEVFNDKLKVVPTGTHCGLVKYGKTHAQYRRMQFPKK